MKMTRNSQLGLRQQTISIVYDFSLYSCPQYFYLCQLSLTGDNISLTSRHHILMIIFLVIHMRRPETRSNCVNAATGQHDHGYFFSRD